MDDVEAVWDDDLHAALDSLPGWIVGRPGPHRGGTWTMYGWDKRERVQLARRSREWTAQSDSEVGVSAR